MIAALIFVISIAALLQFFISYCRSVIAATGKQELSEQAREVTGISAREVCGDEFRRILGLVRLCPEPGNDDREIRAVSAYFSLLGLARSLLAKLAPEAASWAEHERGGCAYFAAVALDRRIAFSREMMAREMANRI